MLAHETILLCDRRGHGSAYVAGNASVSCGRGHRLRSMLRRNEKMEWIRHVPLFSQCSKRELAQIAGIADEIDLHEGKVLIREGDRGREFFVLLDGSAEVSKDGRRINTL